jgi:hypothetical protein
MALPSGRQSGLSMTSSAFEAASNKQYSSLLPAVQRWAQNQASAIALRKSFKPEQARALKQHAHGAFPSADAAVIVAVVRYLALKASAGGSLASLSRAHGVSAFQGELLEGTFLRL